MSIEELKAALEDAQNQLPMSAVESAVTVYHAASAAIDAYTAVKDAAIAQAEAAQRQAAALEKIANTLDAAMTSARYNGAPIRAFRTVAFR